MDEGEATYARDVVVDVSGRADIEGDTLPVFGGGGRFRATVGDGGQIVGMHGVWRDALEADELSLRSVEEAVEAAGLTHDGKNVRLTGAQLGYYSAPSFSAQDLLFPVYAVTAQVRDGDDWIPSRVTLVPATQIGEVAKREAPVPERTEGITLSPAVLTDVIKPGFAIPSELTVSSAVLRRRGIQPESVLTRGPSGSIFVKPGLAGIDLSALFEAIRPRSFGASWIGTFGGLGGSQDNAQGFVDELTAEGWQRKFNWGNETAWKSDWISNDDQYVDDVDFVFYTGHAGPDGWMLATGGASDWLHFNDVGAQPNNPSDHWGRNNLEWAVIAACGPLQDDIINGGGNVHDRWRGVFDGLHLLLGYAAVTYDNTEEGRRLAELCPVGHVAASGVVPGGSGDPAVHQRLRRPVRSRRLRRGVLHRQLLRQYGRRPPVGTRDGRPRHPQFDLPGLHILALLRSDGCRGAALPGSDGRPGTPGDGQCGGCSCSRG